MTADELAKNYKSLPTHRLVQLAHELDEFPIENVLVLQKELITRGEQEAAMNISQYLAERNKPKPVLSKDEMQAEIKARLEAGESLDSIALKFRENGIDLFKELETEGALQENTFDYILASREKGLSEKEINENLQSSFSMSAEEVDIVNQKLKSKGRINLVIGYSTTLIIGILSALSGRLTIAGILVIGLGIWRIYEGHRILGSMNNPEPPQ